MFAAVRPFRWRQLVLLRMVLQCPETLQLLKSSPVLGWLLADKIAKKEISIEEGCAWVFKKRKLILRFVGGPETESGVKFVAKIRTSKFTEYEFGQARYVIENMESFAGFKAMPVIPLSTIFDLKKDVELIHWLSSLNEVVGKNLLADMGRAARIRIHGLWEDTKNIGQTLAIPNPVNRMTGLRSIAGLEKLHDEWSKKLNAINAKIQIADFKKRYGTTEFPMPLLEGCKDVEPIMTFEELLAEGHEMRHCVASYSDWVMRGEHSIYRVLAPERATVDVVNENGKCFVRQIKLKCNGEPSPETCEMVKKWIERQECGGK